jgi:hypothetical protein
LANIDTDFEQAEDELNLAETENRHGSANCLD